MKPVSNIKTHSGTITGAKGGGDREVGRTGTLGRFDVCKLYTLRFHLSPIDSFLPVRNIYALRPRQALRQLACNPSSSGSENKERDEERSESHAVWFCVRQSSSVCRMIYPARRT